MSLQKIAQVLGVLLLAIGLLAFIPNPIVGPEGLFAHDFYHGLVYLISGLLFLGFGFMEGSGLQRFLKIFGLIWLVVAIAGFVFTTGDGFLFGAFSVSPVDNWIHLLLGAGVVYLGFRA